MRTLIDISEKELQELNTLSELEQRSRASLIREAIGNYLVQRRRGGIDAAYGLWGKSKQDGVAYQKRVRAEW